MLKRFFSFLFAFLILFINTSAQEVDYSKPQKVDEFGETNISDIKARLDQTAVQLQNAPTARMFIISYRTKYEPPGKIFRHFKIMKTYLTQSRGIDPSRVITIDGQETNCSITQVWIVPDGQTPEITKSYNNTFEDKESVRKFDSFFYAYNDLEYDYWDGDSLKEYTNIIKKEPKSLAYIILYPEYNKYNYGSGHIDSPNTINLIKAEIRKDLIKIYGLPASRIRIVNGGYRDYRQVELWVLPRSKHAPIATPTEFPRIKKKSGKR